MNIAPQGFHFFMQRQLRFHKLGSRSREGSGLGRKYLKTPHRGLWGWLMSATVGHNYKKSAIIQYWKDVADILISCPPQLVLIFHSRVIELLPYYIAHISFFFRAVQDPCLCTIYTNFRALWTGWSWGRSTKWNLCDGWPGGNFLKFVKK